MSDETSAYSLDNAWVRRSFDQASASYDAAAVLQTDVRNQMLDRLNLTDLSPRVAVSYTHLDVYKRQHCCCSRRCR